MEKKTLDRNPPNLNRKGTRNLLLVVVLSKTKGKQTWDWFWFWFLGVLGQPANPPTKHQSSWHLGGSQVHEAWNPTIVLNEWMKWMNEWMNEWMKWNEMNEWMKEMKWNEWMNEWMNEMKWMNESLSFSMFLIPFPHLSHHPCAIPSSPNLFQFY